MLGVAEAGTPVFPQWASGYGRWLGGVTDAVTAAGLEEDRVAGRSLSLERAADLALRVLDEELALTPEAGGSEATGEALSISSRGGRSLAFRERSGRQKIRRRSGRRGGRWEAR